MSSVEDAIKKGLRELALTKPYKKIGVSDICDKAHVSKTAFYKKFDNKDAVLAQILLDDICEPVRRIRSAIPTNTFHNEAPRMIDYVQTSNILENADFYKRIVSECPMAFLHELTKGFVGVNREVLEGYRLEEAERDYMTFHFAANHTLLIAKWIHDGMEVDQEKIAEWYHKWATLNWEQLVLSGSLPKDQAKSATRLP